jgi:ATP-binding cassette subfamily B protein
MTVKNDSIQDFLLHVPELQAIDRLTFKELSERLQPLRYRMGQVILRQKTMPAQVLFLFSV